MTSTTIPPEDEIVSDEELNRRAILVDFALSDALLSLPKDPQHSYYDGRLFAERLRGNGFEVVPIQSRRSQPDSDREAIIEECAKLADVMVRDPLASSRRHSLHPLQYHE